MSFSYPDLDSEHALVDVARQLAELCKERLPECKATRLKISRAQIDQVTEQTCRMS